MVVLYECTKVLKCFSRIMINLNGIVPNCIHTSPRHTSHLGCEGLYNFISQAARPYIVCSTWGHRKLYSRVYIAKCMYKFHTLC